MKIVDTATIDLIKPISTHEDISRFILLVGEVSNKTKLRESIVFDGLIRIYEANMRMIGAQG